MNKRLIIKVLGSILLIEALAMTPALIIAFLYGDGDSTALLCSMLAVLLAGIPMKFFAKPVKKDLRAREGFLCVGLAWVLLAGFGALPFVFSGVIPNYIDAFFEAVSGFTTTGATVLTSFDQRPRGIMFWRSFTHWIGGMGVLVLTLALLPKISGRTSHLIRAESPGPTLSKIVPRMGDTAKIMYIMYFVLTMIEWLILMLCGMNAYDAAIHAMGTAGTGGFSNYGASVGAFDSAAIDLVITIFMLIFGINFALYFRILNSGWRDVLHSEELRWFLCIFGGATLFITLNIMPQYNGSFFTALRYASFQVSSIISTTGYVTADFNLWPITCRMLIIVIMFIGSCAGSTAGGMKVCRIGMLIKLGMREIRSVIQPRKVAVVRFEGKGVDEVILKQTAVFAFVYVLLVLLGGFVISLEGLYDVETNLTAALTCISNVGPGLGSVGPVENFAGYGHFSKLILSFLMLAGRLELFPMLALFHPAMWKR